MDPRAIEAVIAKRFGLPRAPTLVARVAAAKLPVVFTHLRSAEARHRQSMDVPREQSFSFQVPLTPFPWDAWFAGKQRSVSPAIPGNAYLFDLSNNPTVGLNTPFSTVRLNICQSALDALAYERGLCRASGLRAPSLRLPRPGHARPRPSARRHDGSARGRNEPIRRLHRAGVSRPYPSHLRRCSCWPRIEARWPRCLAASSCLRVFRGKSGSRSLDRGCRRRMRPVEQLLRQGVQAGDRCAASCLAFDAARRARKAAPERHEPCGCGDRPCVRFRRSKPPHTDFCESRGLWPGPVAAFSAER